MSKRSRLVIVLAVFALCLLCLWPSITWYGRTPKEQQALALSSLENIRDYSKVKAEEDAEALRAQAKADHSLLLTAEQKWLKDAVKSNYKEMGMAMPSPLTLYDALNSFETKAKLVECIETRYRSEILANKRNYQNSVKRGLDLSGGMNVVVKADLDAAVEAQKGVSGADISKVKADAMSKAMETLTSRIDRFGLSSPVIRQQGEDRIYIELPGSAEANQINSIIQGRGILNFRLVDDEATEAFRSYYAFHGDSTFDSRGNLIDSTIVPEDCEVFGLYRNDNYGLDVFQSYLVVKKEISLEGKYIKSAVVSADEYGRTVVNFTLDSTGAEIFGKFTTENEGKNLAILSDNRIKSYASINEPITTGKVSISGFSRSQAEALQKVLQTAWLDVPLSVESQDVIGASLGEQAVRQGIMAIIVGLAAIMVFMLIWYKGAGLNACLVQVLNLYMMFSLLSAFNLTITLPSIAGMILTIGMAVDANVIIFERIKEERRLGKDRAASIAAGFDNALWAILDSNITTFIAALFMSQLGSGAIQGFAYSLAVGVVSTLFTTLVVSRLLFDFNTEQLNKQNISISWRMK